jgi:hypothetical protein
VATDPAACGVARVALRARVTTLARAADVAAMDAMCPTTPEWRGRDVLAHLVGVDADILAGRLEGAGTDAWTAVQVDARRDHSVADLCAEWDETGPRVEAVAAAFGPVAGQWVFDACTHEHDLRLLLGAPGARDSDAVLTGGTWIPDRLGERLDATGRPALHLTLEDGPVTLGTGRPATGLRTTRFEMMRALAGRRSRTQIDAWDWDGTARTDDLARDPFPPPPHDVDE